MNLVQICFYIFSWSFLFWRLWGRKDRPELQESVLTVRESVVALQLRS